MGSYLSLYLKDKEEKMHVLTSFRTSSSEIYSTLRDNCNIASSEKYNSETKMCELSNEYTLITTEILSYCIEDIENSIKSWKNRINTYYKICQKYSMEEACIEITNDEEYLKELENLLAQFNLLYKIVEDIENKYTGFTGMYAQVG